jgi:hypothetical protein
MAAGTPDDAGKPRKRRRGKRAAAADPGTPINQLCGLAAEYPREVLSNPAFEVALVADPGFLFSMEEQELVALVRQCEFPLDLMMALVQRRHAAGSMGTHPLFNKASKSYTPPPMFPRVRAAVAVHPNAPAAALELLQEQPEAQLNANARTAFTEPWLTVVRRIIESPTHLASQLQTSCGDVRVTAALARHGMVNGHDPFTHLVLMNHIRTVRAPYLRAQRNMAPAHLDEMIREVAAAAASERRQSIAAAESDPERSADARRAERVEFCGALSAKDQPELLASARNQADRMRATLAFGSQLPIEMLPRLAQDQQWRVRAAVAMHPHLGILESQVLASDEHSTVRAFLARHTRFAEVVEVLARDHGWEVQCAAADNPMASPEVRDALTSVDEIQRSVAESWAAGAPHDGNGAALGRADPSEAWSGEDAAILALRHGDDSMPRVLFAAGPGCPVEVLVDLAPSASWWVRIAIARNPRTPRELVAVLAAKDINWLVRAAASERLATIDAQGSRSDPPRRMMEAIPASTCSDRHMPTSLRARIRWTHERLRSPSETVVVHAIKRAMADPEVRPYLMVGMLVRRTGVRLTSYSDIGRKVSHPLREAAVRCVAEVLGLPTGGGEEAGRGGEGPQHQQ